MSGAETLMAARAAGVSVRLDDGKVLLKAAGPPPEAVLAALKCHKVEIMALLEAEEAARLNSLTSPNSQPSSSGKVFATAFTALERRRPDYVEPERWHQAVDDGRRFLDQWGNQSAALGWTAKELFGLHTPPTNPHPSYDRLARYDDRGLVWVLEGKPVVAMSSSTAAIKHKTGTITAYRKLNKPALGPVGDSLLQGNRWALFGHAVAV
jgi:hypothetical protein